MQAFERFSFPVLAVVFITFFVGFLLAGAAYLVLCRSKIAAEKV